MFKVLDLFAGIGGFTIGLHETGKFETIAFSEFSDFPSSVLAKRFPSILNLGDVTKITEKSFSKLPNMPNVITGGFPCQDISLSGRLDGMNEGTRSGLWSEIVRLVCEIRPRYVIVENVSNLLAGPTGDAGAWFGQVLSDLAGVGYDAEWQVLPASSFGALHHRKRVFIVAYPNSQRLEGRGVFDFFDREAVKGFSGPQISIAKKDYNGLRSDFRRAAQSRVWGVGDVISNRLDRIKAAGNAIYPPIATEIGWAIYHHSQMKGGNNAD